MASIPKVQKWRGMKLVYKEDLLPNQYVVADKKGRVLSGGDIKQGLQWKGQPNSKAGQPAIVYAAEDVVKQLMLESKIEVEAPHGN